MFELSVSKSGLSRFGEPSQTPLQLTIMSQPENVPTRTTTAPARIDRSSDGASACFLNEATMRTSSEAKKTPASTPLRMKIRSSNGVSVL